MDFWIVNLEGSFFKTLSKKHLIEITGSEQELRALYANTKSTKSLKIKKGAPILHIFIKFTTSDPDLNIYSRLYCNTEKHPMGNIYNHWAMDNKSNFSRRKFSVIVSMGIGAVSMSGCAETKNTLR